MSQAFIKKLLRLKRKKIQASLSRQLKNNSVFSNKIAGLLLRSSSARFLTEDYKKKQSLNFLFLEFFLNFKIFLIKCLKPLTMFVIIIDHLINYFFFYFILFYIILDDQELARAEETWRIFIDVLKEFYFYFFTKKN
jgi:hypothetical protein